MKTENQESIFFVSLPKSGTVFTWNCLHEMTGLAIPAFHELEGWEAYNSGRDFSCPAIYACGDYNTQLLLPEPMKRYLHGYVFGAHMQASYHNTKVLEECGINKITVLLRDPRDAFVSWVYHLQKLGAGARNFVSKIYHLPTSYFEWSLAEQFDFQVRTFLPITVNWVEGWLDYYAAPDRRVDILFVLYDELKRDPESYIRRIVGFHDVPNVDFSKLIAPEQGKFHFRKGQHAQWKTEFSPANRRLADELLQNRITDCFERAARSHGGVTAAEEALSRSDANKAVSAALSVIEQYPNFLYGYQLIFRAANLVGVECAALEAAVHKEIGSLAIEDCFIYRENLVNEARSIGRRVVGK